MHIARLQAFCQHHLCKTIKKKINNFNLFETVSFGRDIDQVTRLRLSRITTRLYISFYIVGLTILVLYTAFEKRSISKNIYNPTLKVAQELQTQRIGTVECPCARASVPLEEFVRIQTRFHPVSQQKIIIKY